MRKIITMLLLIVLVAGIVSADAGHPEHTDFEQAEGIINAELPCDSLSDEQLELLGDYYMEGMHPGEAHILMDEMMGGEGSEALREVHINMAKSFYCGEAGAMGSGMMGMMGGGMTGSGMMDSGMIGCAAHKSNGGGYSMMGSNWGMMGGIGWFGMGLLWLVFIALAAFIVGIIFWWTKRLMYPDKKRR